MVNSWLNIWVSYMWTAVEETKIEAILAVMNTTQLVVKLRPEKNSGPYKIWTHDLWNTDATVFFFFFIFFICKFLWQIIDKPPIKSIATSPKWFTSPATSFPWILSVFSDRFWPFKKKLLHWKRYWESEKCLAQKHSKITLTSAWTTPSDRGFR